MWTIRGRTCPSRDTSAAGACPRTRTSCWTAPAGTRRTPWGGARGATGTRRGPARGRGGGGPARSAGNTRGGGRRGRELNEHLPVHVAETVVRLLGEARGQTRGGRLAVLGWAYKGWPPTDDMRGTPIATMMPVFSAAGITVTGHDPLVTDDVLRQ